MVEQTENTGPKQVEASNSSKFAKGKSGNPKGRPKGARNKATLAAEALMDGDAESVTTKAIELAKAGDITAIRLCLERVLPPRKCRPIMIKFPSIEKPDDILRAVNAILSALKAGQVTTDEADALLRTVEAARKAMETEELHRELDELYSRLELINA